MKKIKNAIITGAGRNSGIGAEICRTLAHQGVNIYFTSYKDYDNNIGNFSCDDYKTTLNECLSTESKVCFQNFDLTKLIHVKELFKDAKKN